MIKLFYQLTGFVAGIVIGLLTATTAVSVFGMYIASDIKKNPVTRRASGTDYTKGRPTDIGHEGATTQARAGIDYVYHNRSDAEQVLDTLKQIQETRDSVRISDLKDTLGIKPIFGDHLRGWINIQNSTVSQVREGYVIVFPKIHTL